MCVIVAVCVAVVALKRRKGIGKEKQQETDVVKKQSALLLNEPSHPLSLSSTTSSPSYPSSVLSVSPVNISFLYPLGNGHFGTVYAAQLCDRASKQPPQAVIASTLNELNDQAVKNRFERELGALSSFKPDHPNVLRCVAVCSTGPPRSILYEFLDGVDLKQHLVALTTTSGQAIDTATALDYSCQASKGFEYLAERNYFHGDLAARNVIITKGSYLKITNLGVSRHLHEADYCMCPCAQVLPLRWSAVERVLTGEVNHATDVWSLGVLMFEIFSGAPRPYSALSDAQLIAEMEAGKQPVPQLPKHCPEEVKRVVDECFHTNPALRIQASKLRKSLESLGFLIKSFNNNMPSVSRGVFNNPFSRSPFDHSTSPVGANPYQNFSPFLPQQPTQFNNNKLTHPLSPSQQPQQLQSQQQQPPQHLLLQPQQHLLVQQQSQQQQGFFNMHQVSPTTSSSNNTTSSNLVHSTPLKDADDNTHHHKC